MSKNVRIEYLNEMKFREMTNKATTKSLNKENDVAVMWPSGMGGVLTKGALLLTIPVEGEESNKIGIPFYPQQELEVEAGGQFFGNTMNGVVFNFSAGGDVTMTLKSNKLTIQGDVRIDGDLTVGEDVVTDAGISLNTHTHGGVTPGGGSTGGPQ